MRASASACAAHTRSRSSGEPEIIMPQASRFRNAELRFYFYRKGACPMYDVTTAKLFLLDMDGTFYLDDTLLPGALEASSRSSSCNA